MYRIKAGTKVIIETLDGDRQCKEFNRIVDFRVGELLYSPLTEHHKKGTAVSSPELGYPWGFDVIGKWEDGMNMKYVYAEEVHYLADYTPRDEKTVVVYGSGSNQYTITVDDEDIPVKCSCPAFRYHRTKGKNCKHMEEWNRKRRPF